MLLLHLLKNGVHHLRLRVELLFLSLEVSKGFLQLLPGLHLLLKLLGKPDCWLLQSEGEVGLFQVVGG